MSKYVSWINSFNIPSYPKPGEDTTTVVVEKHLTDHGIEKKLKPYKNYICDVWMTKPGLRNHEYKKEFERFHNLDRYQFTANKLHENCFKILKGFTPDFIRPYQVLESPFIYGADIPVATRIRNKYLSEMKKQPEIILPYTIGALDIENRITTQEIICISFVAEGKCFLAVNDIYMIHDETRKHATKQDVYDRVKITGVDKILSKHKMSLNVYVGADETDLIRWIFKKIHETKPDFIGIWNIRHDIPTMLNRLEAHDLDPRKIMCHPDLPDELKIVDYLTSKGKEDHFTDRWDWPVIAGYSQFYDAMCLFSRVRKTDGRKSSYALGNISEEYLEESKLVKMASGADHTYEQDNHFLRYSVYNLMDSVLVYLLEKKNKDIQQMMNRSRSSHPSTFHQQLQMDRDKAFYDALEEDKVIASVGRTNISPFDKYQSKVGGLVLDPTKARGVGVPLFNDMPDFLTQASVASNDLDFSSEYPSIIEAFNISKTTKRMTALAIHPDKSIELDDKEDVVSVRSKAVVDFFSNYSAVEENVVYLGNTYFNLPSYIEVSQMFIEHLDTQIKDFSKSLSDDKGE